MKTLMKFGIIATVIIAIMGAQSASASSFNIGIASDNLVASIVEITNKVVEDTKSASLMSKSNIKKLDDTTKISVKTSSKQDSSKPVSDGVSNESSNQQLSERCTKVNAIISDMRSSGYKDYAVKGYFSNKPYLPYKECISAGLTESIL